MSISSRVHLEESCFKVVECICHHKERYFKVSECICHHVFIWRKVVFKLRNVYIIRCSSQGKYKESCGMYISSRVDREESCF